MGWTPSCQPALGRLWQLKRWTFTLHSNSFWWERRRKNKDQNCQSVSHYCSCPLHSINLNSLFTVFYLVSCWSPSNWHPPFHSASQGAAATTPTVCGGCPLYCDVFPTGDKSLHGSHICPAALCLTQHILFSCPARVTLWLVTVMTLPKVSLVTEPKAPSFSSPLALFPITFSVLLRLKGMGLAWHAPSPSHHTPMLAQAAAS